jgi:peptidoglycan/LPS O-acetylase OafA/YrhL
MSAAVDDEPVGVISTPPVEPMIRFALLDGLRVFAAFMVLMYHFTAYSGLPVWGRPVVDVFPQIWRVTAYGAMGVQLFFIISGFVIVMSCWDRTLLQFVASRISRLYPAYWAAVGLTALLLLVIWPGVKRITRHEVLVDLTMFQHPNGVIDIDGVYWTLWVELVFYLLVLLLLIVGMTPNRIMAFAALWPILGVMCADSNNAFLTALLEPSYAPLFAGGMLIYLISRTGHSALAWILLGMNIVFAAHATEVGIFVSIQSNTHHELPVYSCWLVIFGFFAVVIAATLTPLRTLRWRWLSAAGILTYPLYLTHQYWGLWVINGLHRELPPYVTLAVTIVAVIALAWAVHQIAERPIHKPFRRLIEKSFARVPTATATPRRHR